MAYADVDMVTLSLHDDHTGSIVLRTKHFEELKFAVAVGGESVPKGEARRRRPAAPPRRAAACGSEGARAHAAGR